MRINPTQPLNTVRMKHRRQIFSSPIRILVIRHQLLQRRDLLHPFPPPLQRITPIRVRLRILLRHRPLRLPRTALEHVVINEIVLQKAPHDAPLLRIVLKALVDKIRAFLSHVSGDFRDGFRVMGEGVLPVERTS